MATDPIVGIWHPAGSSRAVAASLHVGDFGIVQARDVDGKPLAASPGEAIQISKVAGGIVRQLTFADGSVFQTPDNDGIDELKRELRRLPGSMQRPQSLRPRLLLSVLAAVALAFAVYIYLAP